MDGLPEANLPKADIVLITHHHQDHIKTATLNRLVKKSTRIFAPSKCAELIGKPFEKVKPNEKHKIGEIKIKTVYAYNTPAGHSTRKVHHKGECVGYLLTIGNKTIYDTGDTDMIPEMKDFRRVDIAFLPIGGIFTMNTAEAVMATQIIKPKLAIPMHYLKTKPEIFEMKMRGNNSTKVRILRVGEVLTL